MMRNQETVDMPATRDTVTARLALLLGLAGVFILAGILLGLAGAVATGSWAALKIGPALGLVAGGLALALLAVHDVVNALERWTGRDLDRNGRIGDLPPEAEAEPGDLAHRVDRALRYITEQGGSWTRRHLVDDLGLLSQGEWANFYDELRKRAIIDGDGKTLLAVSYKQARALWDKGRPKSYTVLPGVRLVRK